MSPSGCDGRPSILICDDAATVRTLVELQLRGAMPDHVYRQAANGLAALEEIVADPPAAVVLDVNMPLMDGTSLLCLMRHLADGSPLEERLRGGARERPVELAACGVDVATLRIADPGHPLRGAYEDASLDAAVEARLVALELAHRADLELAPDALPFAGIPHFLAGEVIGRPELRSIPVILVTSRLDDRQRARYARLGPADGQLGKPFDAAEAAAIILRTAGRSG